MYFKNIIFKQLYIKYVGQSNNNYCNSPGQIKLCVYLHFANALSSASSLLSSL